MDEVEGLRQRYNEASSWALISEPSVSNQIQWTVGKSDVRAVYGPRKDISIVVDFRPLKITLLRGGKEEIVLNGDGLLHMEHFRNKKGLDGKGKVQQIMTANNTTSWFEGEPDGWWEETFLSWTDKKPKGIQLFIDSGILSNTDEQVRSRCLWTSTSLVMDMCMVSLNARQVFPSQ